MRSLTLISVFAASLFLSFCTDLKSPKGVLKKANEYIEKKDFRQLMTLLSKENLEELEKSCKAMKAVPRHTVADFSKTLKIPADLFVDCTPERNLRERWPRRNGDYEKFNIAKMRPEVQYEKGISISFDYDSSNEPWAYLVYMVKEGDFWKINHWHFFYFDPARTFESIPARWIKVRETVTMRSGPSTDDAPVQCGNPTGDRSHHCDCGKKVPYVKDCHCHDGGCLCDVEKYTTIAAGADVELIGATVMKAKVGSMEDYWFKISLSGRQCEKPDIWVFGGLLGENPQTPETSPNTTTPK